MRGKFAGTGMHIEYHTVNPKKKKPADCVYLNSKRECENKKCPLYLGKCFEASFCQYRVRENKNQYKNKVEPEKTQPIKKQVYCKEPEIGQIAYSKLNGTGNLVAFDKENGIMTIKFGEKTVCYKFPDAITQGTIMWKRDS